MDAEVFLRLGITILIFLVLSSAEYAIPKRPRAQDRPARWFTNWAILAAGAIGLRLMNLAVPLLALGVAIWAQDRGFGLFNLTAWPLWVEFLLAIILLDLAIWAQHLATHKIPILWRLHQVHHADVDVDASTALRFHPIEIMLSMVIKGVVVLILGASPAAILVFAVILNGMAMFNHANIAIPGRLDRILRRVVVTPDMHRVHHSTDRAEHDTNYGFNLSLWDHLFGTYKAQPDKGHQAMDTGLRWRDDRPARLGWSLILPFRRS